MKSPLLDIMRKAGAVPGDWHGFATAEHFGDGEAIEEEWRTVREAAGLLDLSFRGALRVTGPDAADFLHNLLSNDFRSLAVGEGCYAMLLTRESKVVADVDAFREEDGFLLSVDARIAARAKAHLEKFLVAEDAELEDVSASLGCVGVAGVRAAETLGEVLGSAPPDGDHHHRTVEVDGLRVRLARVPRLDVPGFDLRTERDRIADLWKLLRERGEPAGLRPVGSAAFEILRVEAGVPVYDVDFDEDTLALEASLDRGIHFSKGCYLGQEVVERQSARGRRNRRRVGLAIEGDAVPAAGAKVLHDGAEVGRVTSAVRSFVRRAPFAMAIVKRSAFDEGTRLEIETADGTEPAEVVTFPAR